jgi:hypothetical protein
MFEHIDAYAGDPILTLNEAFGRDPRPHKINLSIGIYFDDEGRLPVLAAVREAESAMLQGVGARPYQPMEGAANYRLAVQQLLFGPTHEALTSERIATVQRLFYQALASYATAQQGTSSAAPTIDDTTVCPVFGGNSELQPVSSTGSQTLMTGCSYVSKSSTYVRLEVKSVASSSAPLTSMALAPQNIVIAQGCVVTAPEDSCLSAYSP